MATITELLLQKMLQLMPAVGTPKLDGNIGLERTFTCAGGAQVFPEFFLADVRLSDPRKPTSFLVSVSNLCQIPLGATVINNVLVEFRIRFGTGDVLLDSGWIPLGRGCSISVPGSRIVVTARITAFAAMPAGTIVGANGFISLNNTSRNISPAVMIDTGNIIVGGDSGIINIPVFAKSVKVLPEPNQSSNFQLELSDGNSTYWLDIVHGEKMDWLPIAGNIWFRIWNLDQNVQQHKVLFSLEF